MSVSRSFVYGGFLATLLAGALAAATAQPVKTPAPSISPSTGQIPAPVGPTRYNPMPLPSNVATPSALFANAAYFYRGEPNDPKVHPIPPEVQTGFKRDNRIYCLDWSRKLRTTEADTWSYFITTCQCYPEFIFEVLPKAKT